MKEKQYYKITLKELINKIGYWFIIIFIILWGLSYVFQGFILGGFGFIIGGLLGFKLVRYIKNSIKR